MMEEGVTYMMMGEDGVEQATQLVALQAEDGSQQLAVPVIDPHTGQETYMILDQNSLEGEDGQLLIVGEGEAATLVHGGEGASLVEGGNTAYTVGEGGEVSTLIGCEGGISLAQDENGMIVLPPGATSVHTNTNSVVTTSGPLVQVQIPEEFQQQYVSSQMVEAKPQIQGIQKLQSTTTNSVNSTTVNVPVPYTTSVSTATGGAGNAAPVHKNSFISVPARSSTLEGARENQHNLGGVTRENETYVPVEKREPDTFDSRRQPRKQNLSEFTSNQDHDSGESISRGPPPGLTGDPVQDGLKVDKLLEKVMKNYTLNCDEREELRTKIFANGLGEGKKYLSKYSLKRARDLGIKKERKPKPPRFIKCDQCDTKFPCDIEESKLFAHVLTFHMGKDKPDEQTESIENPATDSKQESIENPPVISKNPPVLNKSPVKSYIDPDQADNIGPQLYRCSDCSDGFLTIKSLLDHQRSKHGKGNNSPVTNPSPQLVSQSPDKPESQQKQSVNERLKEAVREATLTGTGEADPVGSVDHDQTQVIPEQPPSSPSKQKVEVIRKLADEWDDEDEDTEHETLNEIIPKVDKEKVTGVSRCESRTDSVKSETLEDISREVAGIKEDAAKGKLNEAISTNNDGIVTSPKKKGVRKKGDSEDEAKIVADVDDILSDTDALIANVSSTVVNTPQHLKKFTKPTSNTELKSPKKRQSALPPALKPLIATDVEVDSEPAAKKRPAAQCEECFELFEDEEKLAWHNLQDH